MGSCASGQSLNESNTKIDRYLIEHQHKEKNIRRISLFGTCSSGKSTIFKQLKDIHGLGMDEMNRSQLKGAITQNIIDGIMLLLLKSQELYDKDPIKFKHCLVDLNDNIIHQAIEFVADAAFQLSLTEKKANILVFGCIHQFEKTTNFYVPQEISLKIMNFYATIFENFHEMKRLGDSIYMLWNLSAMQATFACRGCNYALNDNIDFFLNNTKRVFSENYDPFCEDLLKCHVPTIGLIEEEFEIKGDKLRIIDVGTKQNKSRHWIHSFEGIEMVIFVAALNDYNKVLFQNETKNAMHESIELFSEICNSKWFRKTDIMLFLNKDDLFREELRCEHSLKLCFHSEYRWNEEQWNVNKDYKPIDDQDLDYQHFENCYQESIQFIKNQYIKTYKNKDKRIFVNVITAIDRASMQFVFWSVRNIIIHSNIRNRHQ